tara:strand:- start:219 stop:1397 length:1179 start_codon:yes stop_codon:yes gene_type:complete
MIKNELELPCGVILKNRLAKSPMSDSLADGEGNPSQAQIRLYERWAEGGVALSIIGEVQGDPRFPEKPGNLVLVEQSNQKLFNSLVKRGTIGNTNLWPQIGHAGALSHSPISQPKGPSPLKIDNFQCAGMSVDEICELPSMYARTALRAKNSGFSGVHIHAGHGFLLSQFLSPLFNHRIDGYGGSIEARSHIIIEVIHAVRLAVGPLFPIGIRINSTDQIEGGLTEDDALEVVRLLDQTSVDLIDISGGTYFPGAKASSDSTSHKPYFIDFARTVKGLTDIPIMATGGFKRRDQAVDAIVTGAVDMVCLGRALVLNPHLANDWINTQGGDPVFPTFKSTIPGGITAWYTMLLTALGEDCESTFDMDISSAVQAYESRDAQRCQVWKNKFTYS